MSPSSLQAEYKGPLPPQPPEIGDDHEFPARVPGTFAAGPLPPSGIAARSSSGPLPPPGIGSGLFAGPLPPQPVPPDI
jgi:hypothetical protein